LVFDFFIGHRASLVPQQSRVVNELPRSRG
jgi:hypothetical protein